MAQSEKQLANLKRGNPATQFKCGRDAVENAEKAKAAKAKKRRRHKTLQETVLMVSKLPMDELGLSRAKRSGVALEGVDEYDLTALTAVVLGQLRAAANGSSQAAQTLADWMDLAAQHKKDQLQIEKLQAELEKTRAETEEIRQRVQSEAESADGSVTIIDDIPDIPYVPAVPDCEEAEDVRRTEAD